MLDKQEIARALHSFAVRHPGDANTVKRLYSLVSRAEDPADRNHFDPGHLTASACLLSPSFDTIALLHHGKLDRWLQPGGHIEPQDANLLESALRELHEETGIAAVRTLIDEPVDIDIHPIPARKAEPAHFHFDVRFAFVATASTEMTLSDESNDLKWFPVDALAGLDLDESVTRLLERSLALARS